MDNKSYFYSSSQGSPKGPKRLSYNPSSNAGSAMSATGPTKPSFLSRMTSLPRKKKLALISGFFAAVVLSGVVGFVSPRLKRGDEALVGDGQEGPVSQGEEDFSLIPVPPGGEKVIPEEAKRLIEQSGSEDSKLSNLEIAEKVLDCLDGMRDARGAYLHARDCSMSSTCEDSEGNNQAGPRVIWAWFKYYQKTGDEKILVAISDDLVTYTTKIPFIQNNFWNCKLMYELWESGSFSGEQMEEISDICLSSSHNPGLAEKADRAVGGRDVDKPDMSRFLEDLEGQAVEGVVSRILIDVGLDEAAFLTSDYVGRYRFSEDIIDLKRAQFLYNQALDMYVRGRLTDSIGISGETCLLGEASLDLYKTTRDDIYLDFASYFWKTREIKFFPESSVCTFFANSFYEVSGEEQFRFERERLLKILIEENFDYKDYNGFFTGDGCFNNDKSLGIFKFSKENSLIVGSLLSEP